LILEKEQESNIIPLKSESATNVKVSGGGGPTLDTQASGAAKVVVTKTAGPKVSRGYQEELEHWAWCIRNRDPQNVPRCNPKIAIADAVIALTTNIAARQGRRIEFDEKWFDIDRDETPEAAFLPEARQA
jgi:hypothetical protein